MTAILVGKVFRFLEAINDYVLLWWLRLPVRGLSAGRRKTVPVIVSMTSFPARIDQAWIAIETICRQSVRPEKFLLVLGEREFERHNIPGRIRRLEGKWLDILWTEENGFSYDKLLPVLERYPSHPIVTVDDDKLFPRHLLRQLHEASVEFPGHIIGARGWLVRRSARNGDVRYGENWLRVVGHRRGWDLITPGGNGCLYPPGSLDTKVADLRAALRECPTADDIWFWAAAQKKGSPTVCLGLPAHRAVSRLKGSPALSSVNKDKNNEQFQRAINYFNLGLHHIS